jgi:hypothetical protein
MTVNVKLGRLLRKELVIVQGITWTFCGITDEHRENFDPDNPWLNILNMKEC